MAKKTAIVTGAADGVGQAAALPFVAAGYAVVAVDNEGNGLSATELTREAVAHAEMYAPQKRIGEPLRLLKLSDFPVTAPPISPDRRIR